MLDVAEATLATVTAKMERSGEEFIISGPKISWDDVVSYIKTAYPTWPVSFQPPVDKPFDVDTSKAERGLGMKWRSMEEIVSGILNQQLELRSKAK